MNCICIVHGVEKIPTLSDFHFHFMNTFGLLQGNDLFVEEVPSVHKRGS